MRRWAVTSMLLLGCRGETVASGGADATSTDASVEAAVEEAGADAMPIDAPTADASAADTVGACPTGTMNLVANSSLDTWDGTLPEGFSANSNVTVAKATGDAGGNVARVTWSSVGYGMYQRVTLPTALPIGCRVRVRGRARYVSGAFGAPSLFAALADAQGGELDDGEAFTWSTDGAWHQHTLVMRADRVTVRVTVFIIANVSSEQIVDLDDFELTYLP